MEIKGELYKHINADEYTSLSEKYFSANYDIINPSLYLLNKSNENKSWDFESMLDRKPNKVKGIYYIKNNQKIIVIYHYLGSKDIIREGKIIAYRDNRKRI